MRRTLPLTITFLAGLVMFAQFFVPHKLSQDALTYMTDWMRIIGAFALVLGIGSLIQRHTGRIRQRHPDAAFSAVALLCFLGMVVLGIGWKTEEGSPFDWGFTYVFMPLDATMFSVLAFFMASAAYRTFRARTPEATLLLVASLALMFGRIPLQRALDPHLAGVAEWIMTWPATAAKRGILLGVALGSMAMSLRLLLGIERSHLGTGKE